MTEVPRAHVDARGEGDDLLILHGWGSSAELMLPVAECLATVRRCTSVDFPGHGSTDEPPDAWGVDEFVDWTIALMDRFGIRTADIVGHSHGGRVAISLAARHPERVAKLVLVAAAGIRSPRSMRQKARTRFFKAVRRAGRSPVIPRYVGIRLDRWVEQQGSPDYRAASGGMRPTLVRLVNSDATPLLTQISAPTLLVWGDHDDETPLSDAQTMERLIPDAGLVVLEGGGHFAYAEQLPRFCHIVKTFLT